ncbi:MAG: hypothetical protein KF878_35610 [Planctomycetes bacterium]|nr:hypothetical protein [Planctomycetota bacterium]
MGPAAQAEPEEGLRLSDADEDLPGLSLLLRLSIPEALRPLLFVVALGALALTLGLLGLLARVVRGRARPVALGVALIAWLHAALWLVAGEPQRLDEGLAALSLGRWLLFVSLSAAPIVAGAWLFSLVVDDLGLEGDDEPGDGGDLKATGEA